MLSIMLLKHWGGVATPRNKPTSEQLSTKSGAVQTRQANLEVGLEALGVVQQVLEAIEAGPEVLDVDPVGDDHQGAVSNLMMRSTLDFRKKV